MKRLENPNVASSRSRQLNGLLVGLVFGWVGLTTCGVAWAQATVPSQSFSARERMAVAEKRDRVERDARQIIESLFGRLCPGRCELVALTVETDAPRAVGTLSPGFEGIEDGGVYDAEVKRLLATVLLDSKLPANFQRNLPRMLQYQLRELAPNIQVRPEVLDFPEPQLQPLPPAVPNVPRAAGPFPGAGVSPTNGWPAPPETEASSEPAPAMSRTDRIVGALAPWLGPIVLVVILLLCAGWLVNRWRSRPEDELVAGRETPPFARRGGGASAGGADLEALSDELNHSRSVRNRLLRQWLDEDPAAVADLVWVLGPQILFDLKADPELRVGIAQVSENVSRREQPPGVREIEKLARGLRARLTAAQLVQGPDEMEQHWDFLEGLGLALLRRLLDNLTTPERAYVCSRLPDGLRAAYLQGLDESQRRDLFLAAGAEDLSRHRTVQLAHRLRRSTEELGHLSREQETQGALALDMLRALPPAEQQVVIQDLRQQRPEVAESVLSQMILDSAYLVMPEAVLVDAIHRMGLSEMVTLLGAMPEPVRSHLLDAAPEAKRAALIEELGLEAPVDREQAIRSRDAFASLVIKSLNRDGFDLTELNLKALRQAPPVHAVSNGKAIA